MNEDFESYLRSLIGKKIDITIVHHVEGQHLRTTGVLCEVTDEMIKIEIEYREHWWQRYRKGLYVCNRKTNSLLSIFVSSE